MVAYDFQSRFVPLVESHKKRQTIRAKGKKRHARPGEWLQLYTGRRTKNSRLLMKPLCLDVLPIEIILGGCVWVAGDWLHPTKRHELALADGFDNFEEFINFFASRLPFDGLLIKWNPDEQSG